MTITLSSWKKLALSLSIIIVINVFFNVGLQTFYPAPLYETYCPVSLSEKTITTSEACMEAGGAWTEYQGQAGYCDFYKGCYETYNEALQPYNRNAFIALTSLGVVTLLLGLFLPQVPMAVANGLLYGGVLSILIGTLRYWSLMDDYLRFIVSGLALALLIGVGIKRLKD